jgi:ribonuclease T2
MPNTQEETTDTDHQPRPDLCDGTYETHCNLTPAHTNITSILRHYGQDDLLAFMDRYWLAARGPHAHLWAHEYTKHATCVNTLAPGCYGASHTPGLEVVDYFTRAAALFRTLDTSLALERARIVPHPTAAYALAEVRAALERFAGGRVVLRCTGPRADVLHEVWYVFFVQGSLQTGQFVPAQELVGADGDGGNCAGEVRYLPKRRRGEL